MGQVLTQSDIITSLLTLRSWFVYIHISSQWARCSTLENLASVCCSICSTLQKPSTFPSSTWIDLLWGGFIYAIYVGLFSMIYVQQRYFVHAHSSMSVDVLAVTSLGTCSATAADLSRRDTLTFPCILLRCTLWELSQQNFVNRTLIIGVLNSNHTFGAFGKLTHHRHPLCPFCGRTWQVW